MKNLILLLAIALLSFISCNTDSTSEEIFVEPLTSNQQDLLEVMKQTQRILGEIISNKHIHKEILEEALLKYDGDYDARISNLLVKNTSKNDQSISFSSAFKKAAEKLRKKNGTSSGIGLEKKIESQNLVIYTPYQDEFDWDNLKSITLTHHPLIREDNNRGVRYDLTSGNVQEVQVTDDYAFENPTLIVKPGDDPLTKYELISSKQVRNTEENNHQVRVGYVKCTKQYDGLFNGGPDFKFCFLGGREIEDLEGEAESFASILSVNLTRKDVRKKRWKNFQYELDDNWVSAEDSRQFGLIEYDKKGGIKDLEYSPSVAVKIKGVVEVKKSKKIKVSFKTGEESWIKTDVFESRTSFMKYNRNDRGQGVDLDGYRLYAAGDVTWSLPLWNN